MTKSVTVFDFDKTLTDKDTLFGFYRAAAGSERLFFVKRLLLMAAGVVYKAGGISNDRLKRMGIHLFLKGKTRGELEDAARRYSETIGLNEIYTKHYETADGEKWIVSASPEIYLKYLFPGEQVAGTTFIFSGEKVTGLDKNMYGGEKKRFLNEQGIRSISELYTDSYSDKPLMDIAEKVFIISEGQII